MITGVNSKQTQVFGKFIGAKARLLEQTVRSKECERFNDINHLEIPNSTQQEGKSWGVTLQLCLRAGCENLVQSFAHLMKSQPGRRAVWRKLLMTAQQTNGKVPRD